MVKPLTGEICTAPSVSMFGQQMSRCDVQLPGEFLMLRVHFQPGALFRMLHIPLYEFGEDYFDAELVLSRDVCSVSEQLAAASSYAEMITMIESYLVRRMRKTKQDVDPADRAAGYLTTDPQHAPVDWLARQACLSPRQLYRKFRDRIGVGPKVYSRLARFHRAHLFKTAHPTVAWPTVALRLGYTDYQHMVRDFRQFANATPNVWLQTDGASPENVLRPSAAR